MTDGMAYWIQSKFRDIFIRQAVKPYHNPLVVDSDGDGYSDYDEVRVGRDPNNPNGSERSTDDITLRTSC